MSEQKTELFEDVEVVLNVPYNMPIERIIDTSNFETKIFKRNGDKPFIKIRYKTPDESKS